MLIIVALFFIVVWYFSAILILHRGLLTSHPQGVSHNNKFSVIIAARNEEKNILTCCKSVLAQNIPPDSYEVIVVNDRSTDATLSIVKKLMRTHENLSVIDITATPAGISPKKHAVSQGIGSARNPVIVFTDADCIVLPTWLATIDNYMDENTGLVQGITRYWKDATMHPLFWGLQSIDFISHGIIACAALGAGLPLNANANNMAFRKEAFVSVRGYTGNESVLLGDDDLLLQRIAQSAEWKARYMTDQQGTVETAPTPTFAALIMQRSRWASVTVHYGKRQVALLSGIFLFYCAITAAIVAACIAPLFWMLVAALLLCKVIGESILLWPGTKIFNAQHLRKFMLPASLLQLPMVLFAVVAGVFGRLNWKSQWVRRKL